MRIKDTEHVEKILEEQMIPIGNVDTEDARHINIGNLCEFVENNIQQKGTFATNEQLDTLQRGVNYLGNSLDTFEVALNNTETWTFELEDGTTITKQIVVK